MSIRGLEISSFRTAGPGPCRHGSPRLRGPWCLQGPGPAVRKELISNPRIDMGAGRLSRPHSADKAHNRKNCLDKMKISGNFCFLRQLHLQSAVTYVHVSSLDCKFASLACRLSQRSASLLTLSTSWGRDACPALFYLRAEKAARRFFPDETIARAHDGDPDAAGRFFTGTALIPAPIHAIMDGKWRERP